MYILKSETTFDSSHFLSDMTANAVIFTVIHGEYLPKYIRKSLFQTDSAGEWLLISEI